MEMNLPEGWEFIKTTSEGIVVRQIPELDKANETNWNEVIINRRSQCKLYDETILKILKINYEFDLNILCDLLSSCKEIRNAVVKLLVARQLTKARRDVIARILIKYDAVEEFKLLKFDSYESIIRDNIMGNINKIMCYSINESITRDIITNNAIKIAEYMFGNFKIPNIHECIYLSVMNHNTKIQHIIKKYVDNLSGIEKLSLSRELIKLDEAMGLRSSIQKSFGQQAPTVDILYIALKTYELTF